MPEVAEVVRDLAEHHYPTETFKQNYDPGLDDLHLRLTEQYRASSLSAVFDEQSLVDLFDYELPHQYYTNGSSEGIFHLLARHKAGYPNVPLYQCEGEYQGYSEYARALGMEFFDVPFGVQPSQLPRPGVFFISAPSAVDGNIVDNSVIQSICEADHYVVIDCAYGDMALYPDAAKLFMHDHVAAVVGSMSKPFGLYYHRIGFLWSRDPVASLYGNKWFKNIFSIKVGSAVLKQHSAGTLAMQYLPWQKRACDDASEHIGYPIKPSDVWLLGHVLPNSYDAIPHSMTAFKRGPVYRFCLTPYYMAYENE